MDKKPLDVDAVGVPRAKVTDSASAEKWVQELMDRMLKLRAACDVPIPDKKDVTIKAQQRLMWSFLTAHGEVVGALKTLLLCGMISERFFNELNQRATHALVPTQVGVC